MSKTIKAEYQRRYREKYPEKYKEYQKKYWVDYRIRRKEELKESRRDYMNNYKKERRKTDINYLLGIKLRNRLWVALKRGYKKGSAVRDLGCSVTEFRKYLESRFTEGMSWDKMSEIHIDHVVPLSSFDLQDEAQLKKACHYTNLQPLWAVDNLKKGATINI